MALSAASCLHYWSSRYGHIPVIGGKPVHSRASTARLIDIASQQVVEVPAATPRDTHLVTISGEERAALLLEMARTNSCLRSQEFDNASWTKIGVTVTANAGVAPDGTATADQLAIAAGASNVVEQGCVISGGTASKSFVGSVWVRAQTGTGTFRIKNTHGGVIDNYSSDLTATTDWQRFSYSVTNGAGAGTGSQVMGVQAGAGGAAVTLLAWGAQLEEGTPATSYIPTTSSAATRAADSFYWDYSPVPQAMMVYCRFVEGGMGSGVAYAWLVSGATNANPRVLLYRDTTGGYLGFHHNGTAAVSTSVLSAPAVGDTVEIVLILFADGSIQVVQSINGTAVTSTAATGALALATAWAGTRLWLNEAVATSIGANRYAEVKFVKYADVAGATAQARMDELRGFELGPNRELLAAA